MIEAVIAVLVITFVFFCLFRLSGMLSTKILLEHAAMRVARARTVGLNDYMCLKCARVAMIPVSGKRIWPEGDELDASMEIARVPIYIQAKEEGIARGVLEYEGWNSLYVNAGNGEKSVVAVSNYWFDVDNPFVLGGKAGISANSDLYLFDQGK